MIKERRDQILIIGLNMFWVLDKLANFVFGP